MRYSGVVLPLFSLPTEYGIGTMGRDARDFVDFLVAAGVSIWETMPINHTDPTGSPHSAVSAFAGNPLLIDLQPFCDQGRLTKKQLAKTDWGKDRAKVNYAKVTQGKYEALRLVYSQMSPEEGEQFEEFCARNDWWLENYAVFVALKDKYDWAKYQDWSRELALHSQKAIDDSKREIGSRVRFYKYLQFLFYRQWGELHSYARVRGVKLLGSITYLLEEQSAEKWAYPELDVVETACDRDYRRWWEKRMDWCLEQFDITKIYHRVKGEEIFAFYPQSFGGDVEKLYRYLCNMGNPSHENIAEVSAYTHAFQKAFAAGTRKQHLPHFYERDSIAYLGTCSDDTIRGWAKSLDKQAIAEFSEYVSCSLARDQAWSALRTLWQSGAGLVLAPVQDFLELGSQARLSGQPDPANNWTWRLKKGSLTNRLAQRIHRMNKLFDRV